MNLFKIFTSFILVSLLNINPMMSQIQNPRNIPYNWKTDTTKRSVDLEEIIVSLPKGAFPKIDYPDFIDKKEGLENFFKHEPVISVEINGEAKAYPLNMLTIHEISNDTLGGIPILPTFCPLCNSGIVYDRRLNFEGKQHELEFVVSGMLRKSDMIMYDKQTESWWQQLMGHAIAGAFNGAELTIIPSLIISVEAFFQRYPNGRILSKKTGNLQAEAQYGKNYYEEYDDLASSPMEHYFKNENIDKRLPPMERIVDVHAEGAYKIYPFSKIAEKGVINDTFKSKNIVIFYQSGTVSVLDKKEISQSKDIGAATVFNAEINNQVLTFRKEGNKFKDDQTNSHWDITGKCVAGSLKGSQLRIEPHGNHFAFAWLAFFPDSIVY
ncbi:DUF3179 domain-containing protein [soil metagenome]